MKALTEDGKIASGLLVKVTQVLSMERTNGQNIAALNERLTILEAIIDELLVAILKGQNGA